MYKSKFHPIWCLIFLTICSISFAQNSTAPKLLSPGLLSRFVGTWKGEGKITGLDSRIVMSWENVLDGKFVKLSFRNEMTKKNGGTQVFEAHAYYKAIDEQKYKGTWFDSGGGLHPLDASLEGNAMNTLWGTEETTLGRTVYRLVDEKKMEVVDYIRSKDGTWREFGRAIYTRQ